MAPKFGVCVLATALISAVGLFIPTSALASPRVAATGSISCSLTATVRFSPPLTMSGGGSNRSAVTGTLTACATTNGQTMVGGRVTGLFDRAPLSCAALASLGASLTGTLKWRGAKIEPTRVSGTMASGSFPGTAGVSVNVPVNLASLCSARKGVRTLRVTGTITARGSGGGGDCGGTDGPITIYPIASDRTCGTMTYEPTGLASGPDGALWFANHFDRSIGRITTSGVTSVYTGTGVNGPTNITAGPDGALWFVNEDSPGGLFQGATIGRITTSGVVTNYSDPSINGPIDITVGSDGALWFTNQGYVQNGIGGFGQSIGRITTSGVVTSYTSPSISYPNSISAGPDGSLWFTNVGNNSIGRITTSGVITDYAGPGVDVPEDITAGPDGALWFTNWRNSSIGRITTSGVITDYTGPGIDYPFGITAGPDGAMWFTNDPNSAPSPETDGSIGRITTSGVVTSYSDPGISHPYDIAAGPDGALWFVNLGNDSVGRITTP